MEQEPLRSCRFHLGSFASCPRRHREIPSASPGKWIRPCNSSGSPAFSLLKVGCVDRREQTRYGVRAPVDFEWIDRGVPHRGRGLTRDISSKGMFIISDSEPPEKSDVQVEVSFPRDEKAPSNLHLSSKALVVRVERPKSFAEVRGFAILNRSYRLHDGLTSIENEDWDLDAN